ncbi:MAG: GIY-YIG nuclease family protein [Leifsonia sp.]
MIALYLLRCRDGSYYVGSTRNLSERLLQHASGKGSVYTSTRLPVELVYVRECATVVEAWALERQVHGWSRAKRKALIAGSLELLPTLSRNRERREADEDG